MLIDKELVSIVLSNYRLVREMVGPDPAVDLFVCREIFHVQTDKFRPTNSVNDLSILVKIINENYDINLRGPSTHRKNSKHHDQWWCWLDREDPKLGAWGITAEQSVLLCIWQAITGESQ